MRPLRTKQDDKKCTRMGRSIRLTSSHKQGDKVRLLESRYNNLKRRMRVIQNTNTLLQAPRVKEIDAR